MAGSAPPVSGRSRQGSTLSARSRPTSPGLPRPWRCWSLGSQADRGRLSDPEIDAAIDAALHRSGLKIVDVQLPDWPIALAHSHELLDNEASVG
jgi:hypothetical protein